MKLLFPSMHGSSTTEIALLCLSAGIELFVPCKGNTLIRTLVVPSHENYLSSLGVVMIRSDDELRARLPSMDAIMVGSPEQIEDFNSNIVILAPRIGLVVRHGLNSFSKYKLLGIKNFITCSHRAADIMNCNSFITRKLIDWRYFYRSTEDRLGIDSYIHHYSKYWPKARERFDELNRFLAITGLIVKNHGYGEPDGSINDLERMRQSIATVHIKDGQAVCNAVIRSMAVGTPVLMDRLTYENCFFDGIDGILVCNTIADLASKAAVLVRESSELEEACNAAYNAARRQFTPDAELGIRFANFVYKLT